MNVLFFIYSLSSGGAERVTSNLANYWSLKGWKVTIVTLAPRENDFYRIEPRVNRIALDLSCESTNSLIGFLHNVNRILALRKVLHEVNPDIAISMMTTANILLAFAIQGLPKIVSIGSERTHPPRRHLGRLWEVLRRIAYKQLDAITALTTESAHWLRTNTKARFVPVIPNVATWPLSNQNPIINPSKMLPPGKKVLIAVGRLDREKGFDVLINAFAGITRRSDWMLVILGEGPLRFDLQRLIKELHLDQTVLLPGRVGNIGEWYEYADIYAMTSHFEGFPNTLVEAMAYGLPSVSFDCDTGPRDIIRHEVDGLLVPLDEVAGLTAALERMMNNDDLRHRFSARAVEVRDRFSMQKISAMWEALFTEILKGKNIWTAMEVTQKTK